MTRACCPACRLHFPRAAACRFGTCPACGRELSTALSENVLGFRLWEQPGEAPLPAAVAMAAPLPSNHEPGRS
jgi:predicted amidophosphoribosyltransferase